MRSQGNPARRRQYHSCTELWHKSMNCSDFLSYFTSYLDGSAPPEDVAALEDHLAECASCRRYRTVIEEGANIFRALPQPEVREDFEPRLRHRLYHVDDERMLAAHQSATPALTIVGIAVLLSALAWAPLLMDGSPDVVLEPIVVDRAPRRASPFQPVSLLPVGSFSTKNPADLADGLWENTLLYEYSALSQRYNQRARTRRAVEPDR